jgi:hypothetical protein
MLLLIPLLLRTMSSGLIAVLEFLCLWHPLSVGCPCQFFLSFLFNQCVFFFFFCFFEFHEEQRMLSSRGGPLP